MNITAGEDPWPGGTMSDPLKENVKRHEKQHRKRHREHYSSNDWVLEKHQTGYSHEQPN